MTELAGQENGGHTASLRKIVFFLLRIGIAVAIIAWLVGKHSRSLLDSFRDINPVWLIPGFALYFFHMLAASFRWHLLLRVQAVEIRFRETFSLMMQGFFFSLVIPGGAIGGDLVKAGFLTARSSKGHKLRGVFTILIDRVVGVIALFSMAGIVGLLCWPFLRSLEGIAELAVYALVAGCFGGLVGICLLFFHRFFEKIKPIKSLLDWGDRLSGGAVSHLTSAMDEFRSRWPVLLLAISIGILCVHLPLASSLWCISRGFGISEVEPAQYLLTSAMGNTAGTIPITPSGVGTRDIVFEKLLTASGADPAAATATALVFTATVLLFNLLGGLCFIFRANFKTLDNRIANVCAVDCSGFR